MKILVALLFSFLFSFAAFAQPGDAQIKKEVGGNEAHVKTFKFTKTTGTKQWNGTVGNWEYVRGVLVVRKSDYPEYDLEVRGDAVYQDMGGGKYSYRKFRVISNQYLGIPDPTITEITEALSKDWKMFYRGDFQKIYQIHEQLQFTSEPYFFWYSPNSVELTVKNKVELVESNVETKVVDQVYKVRLYRDNPKAIWKNFVAGKETSHKENKEYSKQTIAYEKAERLRRKSLAYTMNEQMATSATQIIYPDDSLIRFSTMKDLSSAIHKVLHSGKPDYLKAMLTRLFARNLMVDGSNVQVNGIGEQMINKTIEAAYKGDATYAMQYCPLANIDHKKSNEKHIYLNGGMEKVVTLISGIQEKGAMVNGVAETTWKIANIDVGTRQDDEALKYFASFTDKEKWCNKNDLAKDKILNEVKPAVGAVEGEAKKQGDQVKKKLKGLIKQ